MSIQNPLCPPLNHLFERLAVYNGFLQHLENQRKNYIPLLKRAFEQQNLDPSIMMAGAAFAIKDITISPALFRGYFVVGNAITHNMEEYQGMLEIVFQRNTAWIVGQAYEAFETFLKDIMATYLRHNHTDISLDILHELKPSAKNDRSLLESGLSQNEIEYWRTCITTSRWNSAKILTRIREKIAPQIVDLEKANDQIIDLVQWFDIVSETRHAVTHSDCVIKSNKIDPLWNKNLLDQLFPGIKTETGYEIKISVNEAEQNLIIFAEYAHLIFKALSDVQKYDTNLPSWSAKAT